MAIISGTLGSDTLIGTAEDDILSPIGTYEPIPEYLAGLDGADTYSMYRASGTGYFDYIIDDQGTDGAYDQIAGAHGFYQVTDTGIETFGNAERIGDDLVIHLPYKSWGYRDPYIAPTDIEIADQYGNGEIEAINAGNVIYTLVTDDVGTAGADVMAGSAAADEFRSGGGNDWVFGNDGNDRLDLGTGDDTVFGGTGRDVLIGRDGNDWMFAEDGNDRMFAGGGDDRIDAGSGDDRVRAGAGSNEITTGGGADTLVYSYRPGMAPKHDSVTDFDIGLDRFDFTRTSAQFSDLVIGSDADGDATVTWYSTAGTDPDIFVELQGVAQTDVTADLFLFG